MRRGCRSTRKRANQTSGKPCVQRSRARPTPPSRAAVGPRPTDSSAGCRAAVARRLGRPGSRWPVRRAGCPACRTRRRRCRRDRPVRRRAPVPATPHRTAPSASRTRRSARAACPSRVRSRPRTPARPRATNSQVAGLTRTGDSAASAALTTAPSTSDSVFAVAHSASNAGGSVTGVTVAPRKPRCARATSSTSSRCSALASSQCDVLTQRDARRCVRRAQRPCRLQRHATGEVDAIGTRQHRCEQRGVDDAAREDADVVEARRHGVHAGPRDRRIARLESDDAAERGRPQDRAQRLRTERARDGAVRDRRRGAARRAAGRVVEIPRIARGARMPPCELGRHGLAEEDGGRVDQRVDDRSRPIGHMTAKGGRTHLGRHALRGDDVLERDRHAGERTRCIASTEAPHRRTAATSKWTNACERPARLAAVRAMQLSR